MDGKIPFSRQDYLWRMAQWPSSRTLVAKNIWKLEQEEFTGPQLSPDWKLYYYAKSYIFHCFRTGVVSLCGDVNWSQAALGGQKPNPTRPVTGRSIWRHFAQKGFSTLLDKELSNTGNLIACITLPVTWFCLSVSLTVFKYITLSSITFSCTSNTGIWPSYCSSKDNSNM